MDPNVTYELLRAAWFRYQGANLRTANTPNEEKARDNDTLRAAEDMADALDALNTWLAKGGFAPDWQTFGTV